MAIFFQAELAVLNKPDCDTSFHMCGIQILFG